MLIGDLGQHCGECGVIEYCGNPFGYCLCYDERFTKIEEEVYAKIAENCFLTRYKGCNGCDRDDCEICDLDDERKDFECELIADYVENMLTIST